MVKGYTTERVVLLVKGCNTGRLIIRYSVLCTIQSQNTIQQHSLAVHGC